MMPWPCGRAGGFLRWRFVPSSVAGRRRNSNSFLPAPLCSAAPLQLLAVAARHRRRRAAASATLDLAQGLLHAPLAAPAHGRAPATTRTSRRSTRPRRRSSCCPAARASSCGPTAACTRAPGAAAASGRDKFSWTSGATYEGDFAGGYMPRPLHLAPRPRVHRHLEGCTSAPGRRPAPCTPTMSTTCHPVAPPCPCPASPATPSWRCSRSQRFVRA